MGTVINQIPDIPTTESIITIFGTLVVASGVIIGIIFQFKKKEKKKEEETNKKIKKLEDENKELSYSLDQRYKAELVAKDVKIKTQEVEINKKEIEIKDFELKDRQEKEKKKEVSEIKQKEVKEEIEKQIYAQTSKLIEEAKTKPYELDLIIKWEEVDRKTKISDKEGTALLILNTAQDVSTDGNAHATYQFTRASFLRTSKKYLPAEIITALNLTMTYRTLFEQGNIEAREFFEKNILFEELKNMSVRKYYLAFRKLDDKGLFTRICIRALKQFGDIVSKNKNNKDGQIIEEGKELVECFVKLSTKEPGKDLNLEPVNTAHVKFAIGFIGRASLVESFKNTRDLDGSPHVEYVETRLNEGIKSIYLIGYSKENVDYSKIVLEHIANNRPVNVDALDYEDSQGQTCTVGHICTFD